MSEQTNIEWCDSTWNPWTGCTKVSPACDHCYAESWSKRAGDKVGKWGPGASRVRTTSAYWRQPLKWNAMNARVIDGVPMLWRGDTSYVNSPPHAVHVTPLTDPKGRFLKTKSIDISPEKWNAAKPWRRRVFCASLADWLDNEVPIEWLVDLLDLIRLTPNLDWLLLTKRIGNFATRIRAAWNWCASRLMGMVETESDDSSYPGIAELRDWIGSWLDGNPPANVWIGATICNQVEADRDIPKLLEIPARVRFLSIEPMLGPVDISPFIGNNPVYEKQAQRSVRVPSGTVRGPGNILGWDGVESAQARVGSVETKGGEPTLPQNACGARLRGIPASSSDVGREEGICAGSSVGVAAFQRANTGAVDDQSRGWPEEAERPGQPGIGDVFGATNPCGPDIEGGSCVQSARHEQRYGEADGIGRGNNSTEKGCWGKAGTDSGIVRDCLSNSVENFPQNKPKFWVICGGESGPHARPLHPGWVRSLRDQCATAGVPFLFKQWGEWAPHHASAGGDEGGDVRRGHVRYLQGDGREPDGHFRKGDAAVARVGKKSAGRKLDGVEHNGFPGVRS